MRMFKFMFTISCSCLTSKTISRSTCALVRNAESLRLAAVVCNSACRSGDVT